MSHAWRLLGSAIRPRSASVACPLSLRGSRWRQGAVEGRRVSQRARFAAGRVRAVSSGTDGKARAPDGLFARRASPGVVAGAAGEGNHEREPRGNHCDLRPRARLSVVDELFRPGFHQHGRDRAVHLVYRTEDCSRQGPSGTIALPAGRDRARMRLCRSKPFHQHLCPASWYNAASVATSGMG